jgi:hypothetical protein
VEKHNFTPPEYVKRIYCNQPDCSYHTYVADHLASHVKQVHGIIDANLARVKAKSFFQRRTTVKNSNCKLTFKLRRYQCFVCEDVEKTTMNEYAKHWREVHYIQQGDNYVLKCHLNCDRSYKIPMEKANEASSVFINISFYFSHLVNKHQIPVPDYVVAYRCEIPNCDFVSYTQSSLEAHCKAIHRLTPDQLMEMEVVQDDAAAPPKETAIMKVAASGGGVGVPVSTQLVVQDVPWAQFVCFTCGKEFPSHVARRQHVLETHKAAKPTVLCDICSAGFASAASLTVHMYKKHNIASEKDPLIFCDQCSFSTIRTRELTRHMKKEHSGR